MALMVTNVAEHRIVKYAQNYLARNKDYLDPASLDKLEVTSMRNFQCMTKFTVREDNFKNKLRNQLNATDCPAKIIDCIVEDLEYTDEEMSTQTDCKVEGAEGYLYKIAYCIQKEDNKAKFAMVVFGAAFNGSVFERYEEVQEPVFEERVVQRTEGMLWWRRRTQYTEKVQVGETTRRTPKFKGMTNGDLQACMRMLEAQACEKVLEAAPVDVEATPEPSSPTAAVMDVSPRKSSSYEVVPAAGHGHLALFSFSLFALATTVAYFSSQQNSQPKRRGFAFMDKCVASIVTFA